MRSLNIKDPRVYEMAAQLSQLENTSMTGAVRSALEESLARALARRADRETAIEQFQARVDTEIIEVLTDEDIDDEAGLPR